jgi:hypothetical protein
MEFHIATLLAQMIRSEIGRPRLVNMGASDTVQLKSVVSKTTWWLKRAVSEPRFKLTRTKLRIFCMVF